MDIGISITTTSDSRGRGRGGSNVYPLRLLSRILALIALCVLSLGSVSGQGLTESAASSGSTTEGTSQGYITLNLTFSEADISRTHLSRQALYTTPLLPQLSLEGSEHQLQAPFGPEMTTVPQLQRTLQASNTLTVPLETVQ